MAARKRNEFTGFQPVKEKHFLVEKKEGCHLRHKVIKAGNFNGNFRYRTACSNLFSIGDVHETITDDKKDITCPECLERFF